MNITVSKYTWIYDAERDISQRKCLRGNPPNFQQSCLKSHLNSVIELSRRKIG